MKLGFTILLPNKQFASFSVFSFLNLGHSKAE
jgi:hypothetical protein